MTIAACYLSSEGVVFGADSTSTMSVPGTMAGDKSHRYYNHAQKIFQIGENSTLGMTMWGLGSLGDVSYRTLIAQFADTMVSVGASSIEEVATCWNLFFWEKYSAVYSRKLACAQELAGKSRDPKEEDELIDLLQSYSGGFCLGGYLMHDRTPGAYVIRFDPTLTGPVPFEAVGAGSAEFWGCPSLVRRLICGIDLELALAILNSGKWSGTTDELVELTQPYFISQPRDLPIREAIDWVHASIYTTIKTMKFSHMAPVCGGPVELAVITTDRPFRWVRHKSFDTAICEGGLHV